MALEHLRHQPVDRPADRGDLLQHRSAVALLLQGALQRARLTLFLCGDVMTGRGIDQVLPHPSDPRLYEPWVSDAGTYVRLAEAANGPIPRPVGPAYVWGDALAILNATDPDVRLVNLETAVTRSGTPGAGKDIHYRMHPDNTACLTAAGLGCAVLARVERSEHSRFPVCRGGLEEIIGVAPMKQLLKQSLRTGGVDLAADLQAATFVPESLTGMELLEEFRANGTQIVFVVDEYGDVLGLVTLQDVLEAVTGEFVPRNPEDAWAVQRENGSWLLDGLIPIPELKDRLGLRAVPEEGRGRYHTLAGMLLLLLGRLPHIGDAAQWEGWRLEIADMDGKRVDKVLASRLIAPDTSEATPPDSAPLGA